MSNFNQDNEKYQPSMSEEEIDEIVIAQAEDDEAWEKAIKVDKSKTLNLLISSELTARATFLAQLHQETNVEKWLIKIITKEIEREEANI